MNEQLARPGPAFVPEPRWRVRVPRIDGAALLALPVTGYLMLVFAVPILHLVLNSLRVDGALSVGNFTAYLSDPFNRGVIGNTVTYATWVSGACLLVGYPFAWLMARVPRSLQMMLLIGILLPLASSIVVRSFGWTILLGRSGVINDVLVWTGLVERPVRLLLTEIGLVIGTVSMKLPFMILPIYSVMRLIPEDLDGAAATLGAGPFYRFLRVTLPLSLPGVIVGFAFVFSQTASAYVVPSLLAGARFPTMSTAIVDSYLVLQIAETGSTVSVLLLAIIIFVVGMSGMLNRAVRERT